MLVIIPYPNGEEFISVSSELKNHEFIYAFRKSVLDYCEKVCQSFWESDELDILYNGIRIRLGSEKDFFMLQMKYGNIKEYK